MRNITLLVADDEAMVRTFIKTVIQKEQLPVSAVFETDNGIDAIQIAKDHNPSLIFLDIRMPGCDGLRAAEQILQAKLATSIVMISAYNEFEYVRTAFRAGVCDYLLKPIRPEEVANLILKAAEKNVLLPHPRKPALVQAVEDYIKSNAEKSIQLKDIAQAVFLSPNHLSRSYKQLTGQSVGDHIQAVRMMRAQELLLETDLSITEIAAQVGFANSAYFATCFKDKQGITPIQYRKMREIKKTHRVYKNADK